VPPARGVGPDVIEAAQAVEPALAGAALVTLPGAMTTSALSACPSVSVTVSRTTTEPEVGARMLATAVSPLMTVGASTSGATTNHLKLSILRPQAAVLPEASRLTG